MENAKVIYIASPYTVGDKEENVNRQLQMAHRIIDDGHIPLSPLVAHHPMHLDKPREYEVWIKINFEFIRRCDVLLRLPGESNGADLEVEHAKSLGMPVYHDWVSFLKDHGSDSKEV